MLIQEILGCSDPHLLKYPEDKEELLQALKYTPKKSDRWSRRRRSSFLMGQLLSVLDVAFRSDRDVVKELVTTYGWALQHSALNGVRKWALNKNEVTNNNKSRSKGLL